MMMAQSEPQLIIEAKAALRRGDRTLARRLAQRFVTENPENIDGWLILGGLSNPQTSFNYIQIANDLAPEDPRVRKALAWAKHRIAISLERSSEDRTQKIKRVRKIDFVHPPITVETRSPFWIWVFIFLALLTIFFYGLDVFPSDLVKAANKAGPMYQGTFAKPSLTPTPSPTPTQTFTPTPTASATPTSTASTTPTPTTTLPPTQYPILPDDIDEERWIDVDLSSQRLYAYKKQKLVKSFIISTGTWQHPTLVGQYRVYIKLWYTDMAGPGYYLPDVPYTMYYYSGYGIHGTYWHNNFGTPMSHGCINMRTEDAGWLFNWSHVGILVNIHE